MLVKIFEVLLCFHLKSRQVRTFSLEDVQAYSVYHSFADDSFALRV